MTEEKPKKVGYITQLQDQNEELRARIALLEQKAKSEPGERDIPQELEDRNDEVEVTYAIGSISPQNSNCVFKKRLPKRVALEEMVGFYRGRPRITDRNPPKEDVSAYPVNDAPCYIWMKKKNPVTGRVSIIIRDVPLWLAADLMIHDENKEVKLISKQEYLEWFQDEQVKDIESSKEYNDLMRKQSIKIVEEKVQAKLNI